LTSNIATIDFLSRDCKDKKHFGYVGKWHGLGLEIFCYCDCHNKR
jgi:hypothetical protein